jgi:hypothetical protein
LRISWFIVGIVTTSSNHNNHPTRLPRRVG